MRSWVIKFYVIIFFCLDAVGDGGNWKGIWFPDNGSILLLKKQNLSQLVKYHVFFKLDLVFSISVLHAHLDILENGQEKYVEFCVNYILEIGLLHLCNSGFFCPRTDRWFRDKESILLLKRPNLSQLVKYQVFFKFDIVFYVFHAHLDILDNNREFCEK